MRDLTNKNIVQKEDQGIDFFEIFDRLKKRKWAFLIILSIFLAFGSFYVLTARPVYQSNSTILIGTQTSDQFAGKGKQFSEVDPTNTEFYKTQYALLQSRTVVKNVIRELNLIENSEFKSIPPVIDLSFIKDSLTSIKNSLKSLIASFGFVEQSIGWPIALILVGALAVGILLAQ